jgi:RHS repeat-associated protein
LRSAGPGAFGEPLGYEARYGSLPLFAASYSRDRLGRITTRSETVTGATGSESYGYDDAGRLETVTRSGQTASVYAFDANGNRESHRIGATSRLRGRDFPCLGDLTGSADVLVVGSFDAQDRMQSYGTCTYAYTENGELTRRTDTASGQTTTYRYDVFGNLRQATLPDGTELAWIIDGQHRRLGKRVNGALVQGFLYQGQLNPVAELDGSGNVVATFVYAERGNVPSFMLKGGRAYRIVADHLGSVRLVIDLADGSVAQRMDYDEYGNVVEDTQPGFQPFGYAGGLYDRDLGLVRFGARDYDPISGRWTAKDLIGFEGGSPNLMAYVHANPVNFIDPEGLAQICERRLDNLGGWIPRLGPSKHTQIWYDDGDNIGYFERGLDEDHHEIESYTCKDRHYDDDLMRKVVADLERIRFTPENYNVATNNCQSFTSAADELYRIRANEIAVERMRGGR